MQKVITINLNGNAYPLDETAYERLGAYLEHANFQLGMNPDRAEIVRDIEQSIAEKCQRTLGPGKSVVTLAEVEQMLREIGPIDSDSASATGDDPAATDSRRPSPARLYQIREGGMVSGVCNGLAAYFNQDPTIVRVAFVIVGVVEMASTDRPPWITAGTYTLLVFLVPYAKTSEELAAAQGNAAALPYQVQRLVDRLKSKVGMKDRRVGMTGRDESRESLVDSR